MKVLAIETSGVVGSAAACSDDEILAEESFERGMEHGRMLVPLLDRVVNQAGWDKKKDIDLIAVSRGPGSFTGLRVGIICAKTLAVQLAKPIVAVCSLDGMAENAPREHGRVLTVLDAKRGEVYAAAYERREDRTVRLHGPAVMTPAEAAGLLPSPVFVMGDGVNRYSEILCANDCTAADEALWRIRAGVVARLGLAAYRAGRRDEPLALQPIYLRLPEAEEKRLARERTES